ncbi:hypothetical protein Ahy_B01g052541 [Arachis hypogaea]|uniref:Aminotransferase-like plant mobile domain-containing protein n=1 Tax=Arachis hypogaea TaxID=3818 RepID=A0A445APW3_ARAHY|nr:hypothetical protein Ahy_B01g052541 [Arachis hypogaea]
MARQAGNDENINRLNETTHYAGVADFERHCLLQPRRVSHTLPPPDAIVPYLAEAEFGDTVPLKDFTFDNSLISALVERWHPKTHMFHLSWGEVVPYGDVGIGGAAPRRQASCRSTAGGVEEGVLHAEACVTTGSCPPDAPDRRSRDPPTVRQVLYHVTDRRVSDDQQVQQSGAPGYRCSGTLRSVKHFPGRFSQWYPPDRGIYQYPLAARLVGLSQQSKDQHEARVLRWRVSIDRLRFDEDSSVPLLCFNIIRVHHVDRVKRQFNGEQQVPGTPDVWWPLKVKEWYDIWHQRFEPSRRITMHHTFDTRPTLEYYDWWRGAFRVRHLSRQEVLEDLRLPELPPDVQPTASQPRDDLALPRGVPDRRRHVREGRDDTRRPARRDRGHRERRPGEPVRRERARPRRLGVGVESDEEAEYAHQEEHGDITQHREASGPPPPPPL